MEEVSTSEATEGMHRRKIQLAYVALVYAPTLSHMYHFCKELVLLLNTRKWDSSPGVLIWITALRGKMNAEGT